MVRFRHIASVVLFAVASPVMMPVAPVFASGGSSEGASSDAANNKALDLSGLVLPVERDGELINYLFVSAIVTISDTYDHWTVRERAHVYRDLVLKEAHETTVGLEGHPMEIDQPAFEALIHKVFDSELGPGSVTSIEITAVDSQKIFIGG